MDFINSTPFVAAAWETINAQGLWSLTHMVRVKWQLQLDKDKAKLKLACKQGELHEQDIFFDQHPDCVRYESDYCAEKLHTDIIVNANSYSPSPKKSWHCAVGLYHNDHCLRRLALQVKGPKPFFRRQALTELPIRYTYSKGGVLDFDIDDIENTLILDPHNPAGRGMQYQEERHGGVQIDYADDQTQHRDIPAGFGIIHRAWQPRLAHAGTYDDAWIKEQHPKPPKDFDSRHHQAAHPALTCQGFIPKGAQLVLENLLPETPHCQISIPDYPLLARLCSDKHEHWPTLNLDTLLVDISDPENYHAYGTWRACTPVNEDTLRADILMVGDQT